MKLSTDEPLPLELDDATLFCDVDTTVDPTIYKGGEHESPHGATLEGVEASPSYLTFSIGEVEFLVPLEGLELSPKQRRKLNGAFERRYEEKLMEIELA